VIVTVAPAKVEKAPQAQKQRAEAVPA